MLNSSSDERPGKMLCRICGNSLNNMAYRIREMLLGFRDEFNYFECSGCGCLQIAEIPKNMEKYYPPNYLSPLQHRPSENVVRRFLGIRRDKYTLFKRGWVGRLYNKVGPKSHLVDILNAIARVEVSYRSRVLDVGCGSGETLWLLKELGIRNLVGVDPYARSELMSKGMKILKQTVHDLPDIQKFDLILLNHSFEHIDDEARTLLKISDILDANGVCLIRMPLKTEYIWNLYGVNWVQIDAPRHFFIHTMKSFGYLVKEAGLEIKDVVFDSNPLQFWGSEQYMKDIPLQADNSYGVNPERSIFTKEHIEGFWRASRQLNRTKQGDQATFYLVSTMNRF